MTSYPLSFPAVGYAQTAHFGLERVVSSTASEFTFKQQVYLFPGEQWRGTMTFPPLSRATAALLQGWLVQMKGMYGTFLYGDPMALGGGKRGAGGGTPLVNGGSQTGNTLIIDGCSNSITGWLKTADYFQLGTGATARLYMLTQDADTNVSGQVTLYFEPALRSSPADNDPLTITSPMGVMRLESNSADWSEDKSQLLNFTISFKEHIDG